jgi:hypothetical protein
MMSTDGEHGPAEIDGADVSSKTMRAAVVSHAEPRSAGVWCDGMPGRLSTLTGPFPGYMGELTRIQVSH